MECVVAWEAETGCSLFDIQDDGSEAAYVAPVGKAEA